MVDKSPLAFPVSGPNVQYGMSLLDYFAGQALVGMLLPGHRPDMRGIAADAYAMATAMVQIRKERNNDQTQR